VTIEQSHPRRTCRQGGRLEKRETRRTHDDAVHVHLQACQHQQGGGRPATEPERDGRDGQPDRRHDQGRRTARHGRAAAEFEGRARASSGGKFTVTDGPFTEAKELIAGFAIIRVSSKAEAIEWGKRFLTVAGDGESEIRLMWDTPAFPPEHASA
jgi:hypothetical protein